MHNITRYLALNLEYITDVGLIKRGLDKFMKYNEEMLVILYNRNNIRFHSHSQREIKCMSESSFIPVSQ
jgi:hypothetical protein